MVISLLIGSNSLDHFLADYDAPLSENGGYTAKYDKAAEMIAGYDTLSGVLSKPQKPEHTPPVFYPDVQLKEMLDFNQIISNVVRTVVETFAHQDRLHDVD